MKSSATLLTLAAALTMAACGPASADNSMAATAAQNSPLVAQVGFNDLLRDPATPFLGAENADITIIGFMDYNCPYCKKMIPELEGLMRDDPKVRILYKEWPIFGALSDSIARIALAAGYHGKYHAIHTAFMATPGRIQSEQEARRLAQAAGIDMAQLDRDLTTHRAAIDAVILRNRREAAALALNGTPAFVINGNLIPGGMSQQQLQAVIFRIRSGMPLR
ncbi:DsbA family protein [Brevundimonas sp.]|uniref:DsbA family protein n=1 Tax=Brevundimonas sp. TaxID=1871086 RepID=UPI0025C05373|nr:DsbA family protein [Brevundimonas sp.]